MKFSLTFCLLLMFGGSLLAQNDSIRKRKLDSLNTKLKKDSLRVYHFSKYRPFANYDNRNSFIGRKPVTFIGIQLGVIYKERHVFGFGYYKMTQQSQRLFKTQEGPVTYNRQLKLNYFTLFYQYVLLDSRFVELDLPFELGFGKFNLHLTDATSGDDFRRTSGSIVPTGAGLQVVLKPFRFVGFSVMGGYRYVYTKTEPGNLNFNGWYYSFGLFLDIRQIYRDLKFYLSVKKKYRIAKYEIEMNYR